MIVLWYHKKKAIDAPIITKPPPVKIPATFVFEMVSTFGEDEGEGLGDGEEDGVDSFSSFSPRTLVGDFLGEDEGDFGDGEGEFLGKGLGDFALLAGAEDGLGGGVGAGEGEAWTA